jgi:hypothetical protein
MTWFVYLLECRNGKIYTGGRIWTPLILQAYFTSGY